MGELQIPTGDIADAEDIDFQEEEEHWNVYKLNDGVILKVKLVLRDVKRLKKYLPDGNPIYAIDSTNVVRIVDVPKQLKQKPKSSATPIQ